MTTTDATSAVADSIRRIVPDADFSTLDGDAALRDVFELDSLDFLVFVEQLSTATGKAITETDYPRLRSMNSCIEFLAHG